MTSPIKSSGICQMAERLNKKKPNTSSSESLSSSNGKKRATSKDGGNLTRKRDGPAGSPLVQGVSHLVT
jgi:hypothetical protein